MNKKDNWMNFAYMDNPTLYTSAYLVASPQGYTKHYYAGSERIASAIGLGGLAIIETPLQLETYHHSWSDKSTSLKDIMKRTIKDCLGNDFYCKQTLEGLYHLVDPNTGTMDRYFYHPDHLGSSSWITDGSGNAIQHLHYLPFGEDWVDQRNSSWNTPYTFSGKEKDAETGYGYFGARYYDSSLSIWLSVDPMSDKYPSMSPYNYCANNPVILVDPDGKLCIFINGLTSKEQRAKKEAWYGVDQKIINNLHDKNVNYYNGAKGGITSRGRMKAGEKTGYAEAANIFSNLQEGETIKIITYSMGASFGKGFIKGLQKYAKENNIDITNLIEFELDLNPWQPSKQKAIENIKTIDAPNINDSWAGSEKMEGAIYQPYGNNDGKPSISEHSLQKITQDIINKLIPEKEVTE